MVCQKQDAHGNPFGSSNWNPIVDAHLYEVEFLEREITEFIIAELIYALCDIDGNGYILLEALIHHRKTDSSLSEEDQKIV